MLFRSPKSNRLLKVHFNISPWRTQTDAPNAMARTHKVVKVLHSQIPPKQLMLWREMGGRTRKTTNESQDLDPIGSSHKEEIWIDGNVDLDLLSLFPQEGARIIGGIER